MTVLTKATDKKKLLPIPTAPISSPSAPPSDVEAAAIAHARHRARTTTCLVFLMAVLVLLMGILAGVCFYRQYLREKVQRLNCFIPYSDLDVDREQNYWVNTRFRDGPTQADSFTWEKDDDDSDNEAENDVINSMLQRMFDRFQQFDDSLKDIHSMESEIRSLDKETVNRNWFKEEIAIQDDDNESFADIKVPDFRDGRRGRFVHDFKNNVTTIIDEDDKRCFVYPLDYDTTLPPQSLADVFIKMQTGYYFPDTTVLNKKMRVVLPELDDDDDFITPRTENLCRNKRVYRLEPLVSGVFKRSIAEPLGPQAAFAEFAGKGIVNLDLLNIGEVETYEKTK